MQVRLRWFACLVFAWLGPAQAQALMDMSAEYSPSTPVAHGDPTSFQISSYQLTLALPIRLSPTQFLTPGITYHADTVAYPGLDGDTRATYHAPELSAMFVQLLPRRFAITLRGAASVAGNLDTVDRRMIAYTAMALVGWGASDRLALGAGMLLNGGFRMFQPLPALSLRWLPRDDLRVDIFVPAFAQVRYTLWDRIELGARAELAGKTYAIRGDEDRMACAECLDHVRYTTGSVGLLAGVRLTSSLWLTAFAGSSVYRRAERMDRDDDQLAGTSDVLPRAMFVRTNLTWRMPGS